MWGKIHAYLTFTRKERLGVLLLLVIIIILFVIPYFVQPQIGTGDEQASQKYGDAIREFRSAGQNKPEGKKDLPERDAEYEGRRSPSRDEMHYTPEENGKSGEMKSRPAPFYFDPNRIQGQDWRRLDLSDRLIVTIAHYLQKGGRFRNASDLKKLYGLKPEDYERLFPYVRIPESADGRFPDHATVSGQGRNQSRNSPSENPAIQDARKNNAAGYHSGAGYRKEMEDLDINQADSSAWSRLPGIGIKLAARIIRFRGKLGGFYETGQVAETFGLPDSTFQKIKPFLHISNAEVRKLDLNTAAEQSLQTHPYIRWKLAKGIVQYREQHGGFKTVSELQQLALMDAGSFKKLEPYLEVK